MAKIKADIIVTGELFATFAFDKRQILQTYKEFLQSHKKPHIPVVKQKK